MNILFFILGLITAGGTVSSSYFISTYFDFFYDEGLSTALILGSAALGLLTLFIMCTENKLKEFNIYTFVSWLFLLGVSIYNAALINSTRIQDMSSNEDLYIFYILYLCALFISSLMLLIFYFTLI
tara:strand:+ start:141 stop:518 length:378 start_codon:yes stop_codon:yes gene_type:complete